MSDTAQGRFDYQRASERYQARARARYEREQAAIEAARLAKSTLAFAIRDTSGVNDLAAMRAAHDGLERALQRLDALDSPTRSPSP
jgi:hypothetical protein